jgi:hypothetical protein
MKFATEELMNQYREENGLAWNELEFDADQEYSEFSIINPENSQKTINALIPAEDCDYEQAKRELTITSRYHDWSNTIADHIYNEAEDYINSDGVDEDGDPIEFKLSDSDIKEYNKQIGNLNKYADKDYIDNSLTARQIIDIAGKNSYKL